MNKRTLSVCGTAMFLVLLVSASAFGYEKEIEQLSAQMAEKIAGKDKKTVAVVDFTDLEGNVTQLDRFIAEEFSVALASTGKGFRVIDRTNLKSIIKENKLSATGLIDTATARKLGKIAGVDALVTGTLTPFGDNVRLTVKVLDSDTADIIDSAKSNFAKTPAIEELLGKELMTIERTDSELPAYSTRKQETVNSTVEQKNFIFELHECRISGQKANCSVSITSKGKDMKLRLGYGDRPRSRIFDNYGNEYPLSDVKLANKTDRRDVESLLVANIKTKSSLSFEGLSPQVNIISLLEIEANADGDFIVQFRDIHLK